jgi:hypothetical protein
VAFDAQSAWLELGALIAAKPNHGRHDLLTAMAQIAERHSIPEEEFRRALRLTLPQFAELLFERTLRDEAPEVTEEVVTREGLAASHRGPVRPTIAA